MTNATYIINGDTAQWEIVMGLEVHAQVISNSKLFSGASTQFGQAPNDNVSLVDVAMPGMLPVVNEHCIEQAVKTGLGLNAKINTHSVFERKNYFYPDLPQGYQISQYLHPIVGEGEIEIDLEDGSSKTIRIERLHLEQDAGKSMHDQHPSKTYVDLNRSGVALMEIVSKPDLRTPEEAGAYVKKLRAIMQYLETCDGNMDQGNLRCDVNLSVRKVGETTLGTRTETKNVNSIKNIMMAIEYEAQRQVEVLESGGSIDQETRLWDPDKNVTRSMRSKEEAHDYRYFPDPDLLPVDLPEGYVSNIEKSLPELPDQKKSRFMNDYGLSGYDTSVLTAEKALADYFEGVVDKNRDAKKAANWVINELLGGLNKDGKSIDQSPIKAEQLGELLDLMADDTISGKIAKQVFAVMLETGQNPEAIVEEKGLKQVTDTGAIEKIIDDVIAANPTQVEQYKGGKENLFGFFVGQTMKATQGKANPAVVNKILKEKLS